MKKLYMGVLLCTSVTVYAQGILWEKNIKSSTQEFFSHIITTIDQQYLIAGSSIRTDNSKPQVHSTNGEIGQFNNGYDFHVVKLNQEGKEVWERYFSGQGHDYLSASVATQEGGFLLAGTSYSGKGLDKTDDLKGGSDIWVIRINEFGDELWQKTIGGSSYEEARSVIQTTDLGFYVAGNVENAAKGYGSKDVLIIRLDKTGKEQSQILLGGKGIDQIEKMIPTKDGGALLGIYSRSSISGSKKSENFGEGDFWIIKLDKEGKVDWEKSFGGKDDDHLKVLSLTSSGYIIGGQSRSDKSGNKSVGIDEGTDIWLISLNDKGEEQWQRSFNFSNRDILTGLHVTKTSDEMKSKGILLGGYTQAEGKIKKDDETFWVLYLDQNGNEQWRKHIEGESKKKEERLIDLTLDKDGSILLAGTSGDKLGKENWKVIKLGDKQIEQIIEKQNIKIYPNPVSDYAYIEIGFEFKAADIIIYDMGGRELQNINATNRITKIDTQSLVQGAYLIVIKTDTNMTATTKLI